MNTNEQLEMEKIIAQHQQNNNVPTLLLHSCCAPCSSYVLETLSNYFKITIFYYNPNIYPIDEYLKRKEEEQKFIKLFPSKYEIKMLDCDYDSNLFFEMTKGLENLKEGEKRCYLCYQLRMEKTAIAAKENNFDYFTTTLSISPYKNSDWINEIGNRYSDEKCQFLYSNYKKEQGYLHSIELSKQYDLYRQDYSGCVFSKMERMSKKVENILTIE